MRFSIIIIALFASVASQAQSLTLEQCRDMALRNNHKITDSRLTTRVAEQAVRQYRANYFPDISLNGIAAYNTLNESLFSLPLGNLNSIRDGFVQNVQSMLQNSTLIQGLTNPASPQFDPAFASAIQKGQAHLANLAGIKFKDFDLRVKSGFMWHGGAILKQPLFMGGKITAGYRIAKHSLAMAKQNERLSDTEVIEQADQAFINVVRAQELRTVATKYLELLAELEKNVESAVRTGMKIQTDLLRVQVKRSEIELQLLRADNAIRLAKSNLNYVIGNDLDADISINYAFDDEQTAAMPAVEGLRPERAILEEKAEIARQQVKVARAALMPQAALLASGGYTKALKINDYNVFNGWGFTGGVTVSIPITHFGERTSQLKQAKIKAEQAAEELKDVEQKLRLALIQAQNTMLESEAEVNLTTRSLEQAEKSMKIVASQYKNGTAPLSDLLDAQAQWQRAYETRIEAVCSRHTAYTALQKTMGILR